MADSEQQKIVDIAYTQLNESNMTVRDGLKVLVETTDNVGVVTIEAVVPEGSVGGDFTFKITIDKNTGEVTKLLLGG